jgi:carboxylesterase type B
MQMDGAGQLFHSVIMQSNPSGYRYRSITVANFLGQAVKRGLDCTDLKCMQVSVRQRLWSSGRHIANGQCPPLAVGRAGGGDHSDSRGAYGSSPFCG